MVQRGDFSVELIDAKTKEIFKEHSGFMEEDGVANPIEKHSVDAFVEIEPESEYFLRVANDSSSTIICNIQVDGSDLGYEFCLGPNEYDDKGIWKLENGKSQHTALKVHKVLSSTNAVTESKSEIGVISVDFYEYIDGGATETAKDFSSKWNSEEETIVAPQDGEVDAKRQVKSQQGSHSEVLTNDDGKRNVYKYGDSIESIRLKYCTVVGLISEGVLEKPPLWEWARLTNSAVKINTEQVSKIEPKIVERKTCDDDGKIIEVKKIEMFDLTSMEE